MAQDVFGHAAASLAGWGWSVDEVAVIGKTDDADLFVEEGDVEIIGAHEGSDGGVDARVEAGEVGGGVDGFGNFEERLLHFFGAVFFGDSIAELFVGGDEFGSPFMDPLFEFGIHRANGGFDGFAAVDLSAKDADPGDGEEAEACGDGEDATWGEGAPPGGGTENADVGRLAEDDAERAAAAGSAGDGGTNAGDFGQGVFGNALERQAGVGFEDGVEEAAVVGEFEGLLAGPEGGSGFVADDRRLETHEFAVLGAVPGGFRVDGDGLGEWCATGDAEFSVEEHGDAKGIGGGSYELDEVAGSERRGRGTGDDPGPGTWASNRIEGQCFGGAGVVAEMDATGGGLVENGARDLSALV